MDDGRSQRALHDLQKELTDIRHRITLCKPPSQQVQVLEAAITKKKLELVQAKDCLLYTSPSPRDTERS
eukprot:3599622-Karenia_brevis.AAC.1